MISSRYIVWMAKEKMNSCILILPGRDQTGVDLARSWCNLPLSNTAIVLITPDDKEWYPMPNGILDQQDAVNGLEKAYETIQNAIIKINKELHVKNNKIALIGFSAGGVMANYVCMNSPVEYAACVCHSGAILEPENVPFCKHKNMPFVLTHSYNDDVFDWDERYLPMKNSLNCNGYNVISLESYNRHYVTKEELEFSASCISKRLGY